MAIEITKQINKHKYLALLTNFFLKLFLKFIRIIFKIFPYESGNIVVVSISKLGDTVFTIPAIREIQKFYKRDLTIFCLPDSVPIYKLGLSNVGFCTVEQRYFSFNKRIASTKARKKLKSLKPEILFDLSGMMTSATLIFNSSAKTIIGMNRDQFKPIYDHYVPIRKIPHLMDTYLDIISSIKPIANREQIKIFPEKLNRKGKILIHPFAGWKAKEWNLNKFINLAVKLEDEYNVCLVVPNNSIPDEVLYEVQNQKIEIVQTKSVTELINQIKECSVFIGNDSGPLYIAGLLGRPTFTIYGPTNFEYSHPLGENHKYINSLIKCSPQKVEQYCFTTGGKFGCPAFQCMNQLDFEKVSSNLLPFVRKYCNRK